MNKYLMLFLLFVVPSAHSSDYSHFQGTERFPYETRLFQMAMEKVDQQEVNLVEVETHVNYARGMVFLDRGVIDFAFFATNDELEQRFLPVKIPILNGILGYRINLIHKDNKDAFKNITTLNTLTDRFLAGFNEHWPDKSVLVINNMPTVFSATYDGLFRMLNRKRFDYFPRGINEVWTEYKANIKHAPNIMVESNIAFFYPYPVYFFVKRDNHRLADKLKKGLAILLKDGSFKAWFLEYHRPFLKQANLKKRTVIELLNPDLPTSFDPKTFDTSWWRENNVVYD